MEIRKAISTDLPGILAVLKKSLGETSSQKTEAVWNYKHVQNPFGESLVLVACINDTIVGVRAFMRWKWQLKAEIFSVFRAVDTATDPDYQGKGIFKKLTLEALKVAKEEGDNFVFNTPNAQSKPGYLKMGWQEVDKINLFIRLANPINYFSKVEYPEYKIHVKCSDDKLNRLLEKYNEYIKKKSKLYTPKNRAFLKWRYEENKLQNYQVYYCQDLYMAVYIKSRGNLNELRVSECIFISDKGKNLARQLLKTWNNYFKANFISYNLNSKTLFRMSLEGNYGPMLTFKEIQFKKIEESFFLNLQNWSYSLGDLELF